MCEFGNGWACFKRIGVLYYRVERKEVTLKMDSGSDALIYYETHKFKSNNVRLKGEIERLNGFKSLHLRNKDAFEKMVLQIL